MTRYVICSNTVVGERACDHLTLARRYPVLDTVQDQLRIVDDAGAHVLYPATCFSDVRTGAVRTSLTDPLKIATLPVGALGGAVGVTFAPGKIQPRSMTGHWARDLNLDLIAITAWGARDLISLLEPAEFIELQIESLPLRAAAHGLTWHGLPMTDGAAPDARFLTRWTTLGPALVTRLQAGQRVVIHCKGGLGRAGTVAALLLLDSGSARDGGEAIRQVRAVRRGAIETPEQERFLLNWHQGVTQRSRET